jgi:hypothetical protein
MKYLLSSLFATCLFAAGCHAQTETKLFLVKDGRATAVIVAPAQPPPPVRMAIDELQYHLKRAAGVTLKVVDEKQAHSLPADTVRVLIGGNETARKYGVDASALPLDTYRVKSVGNSLIFAGHDSKVTTGDSATGEWNAATQWAVDHYLDTQLGVRWLWPGDVGTYVPHYTDIPLPDIDDTGKPALETRILATRLWERSLNGSPQILSEQEYRQVADEGYSWLRRFQMGNRSQLRFGHAFTKWWSKYGAMHPEYFAVPPPGSVYKQPWPSAKAVKLNVGNEAVDDAVIAEWKAAGAPDNWDVCPNDGVGFDTSDASRALDDPLNQDPELIWSTPKANLTARYVKFWNRLIVKMRKINPDVTLSAYAYSAYRNPPLHGLKLEPNIILEIVPTYWAQDDWLRWQQAGARLFLRPNWWHSGGVAPVIPLHRQGDYFKFALGHNMTGFNFDSLHGYWATKGPMYYVIARLSVHPEMSVDDVIGEYCSAFGKAAPEIKNYLNYWEQFSEKAAYSVNAGGEVPQPKPGLYTKILEENNLSTNALVGSWLIIPHLYTDEVLSKAYRILDNADADADHDDDYVKQRIRFLREGLNHLKLTREVLKLGYLKTRTVEQEKQYEKLAAQLQQLRHQLTLQHVIWGEVENVYEARRHAIPTMPAQGTQPPDDVTGM